MIAHSNLSTPRAYRLARPAALSRPNDRLRVLTDLSALRLLGEVRAFALVFSAAATAGPAPPRLSITS